MRSAISGENFSSTISRNSVNTMPFMAGSPRGASRYLYTAQAARMLALYHLSGRKAEYCGRITFSCNGGVLRRGKHNRPFSRGDRGRHGTTMPLRGGAFHELGRSDDGVMV